MELESNIEIVVILMDSNIEVMLRKNVHAVQRAVK
jgi:hypothetical protein